MRLHLCSCTSRVRVARDTGVCSRPYSVSNEMQNSPFEVCGTVRLVLKEHDHEFRTKSCFFPARSFHSRHTRNLRKVGQSPVRLSKVPALLGALWPQFGILTLEIARCMLSSFAAGGTQSVLCLSSCLHSFLSSLESSSSKRGFLQACKSLFSYTTFLFVLKASFVLRILEQITPKNSWGMMKRTWESTVST